MSHKRWIALALLLSIPLAGTSYCCFENTALTVTEYHVESAKLPRAFDSFRICQISDFHNTHAKTLHRQLIKQIKQAAPDLIAITGDLIDSRRTDVETAAFHNPVLSKRAPFTHTCRFFGLRYVKYPCAEEIRNCTQIASLFDGTVLREQKLFRKRKSRTWHT